MFLNLWWKCDIKLYNALRNRRSTGILKIYCWIQWPAVSKRQEVRWCIVFVDLFRHQLAIFGNRLLMGLSRLLHAHIEYEIDTAKIIAAFCRISCCLYDLIRLNLIACRVQATRFTMMQFSLIDSVINWLCLGINYWYGCLDSFVLIFHIIIIIIIVTSNLFTRCKSQPYRRIRDAVSRS